MSGKSLVLTVCAVSLMGVAAIGAEEPLLQTMDVFVSGQDGYFAYRIPAIETAPDGTLLAFAEGRKLNLGDPGYDGNDIDLVMKVSGDQGRTWSAMRVIEDAGDRWSAANPATVVDRQTGTVWLIYIRCKPNRNTDTARPGTDDLQILARTSSDSGKTWSEPADLTAVTRDMADTKWRASVVGPGGGVQDRTGRLVLPFWSAPNGIFAVLSEDHGKTWIRGKMAEGIEGDECQLVELFDGHLLLDVRQNKGPNRWQAVSSDGGRTWSPPKPGEKVTPVCCAIERFAPPESTGGTGRLLWTGLKGPDRANLVVRVSDDDGRTFGFEKAIGAGPAAYSDLTVLHDRSVGVFYERGPDNPYQFLTFTRFNQAWLQAK